MADYSPSMVAAIRNAAPLTFEAAEALAATEAFVAAGKTTRSVIAKAKSEGIDYIPKAKPTKRAPGVTKKDIVESIAVATGLDSSTLTGLDKANTSALNALLGAVS